MKVDNIGIQPIVQLFNTYKDAILILKEDFIIEYANKKAEDLFPILKEKATEVYYWDIVSDFIEFSSMEECKELKSRDHKVLEFYHKTKYKWFQMAIDLLDDFGYSVTLIDITEKIELKKKLNNKNEIYKAFMKASFDNIYEYDPKLNKHTPIKTEDETIFKNTTNSWNMEKYLHPDDGVCVKEKLRRATLNKEMFDLKHRFLQPNGEHIWINFRMVPIPDENGDIVKWIGTTNDITLEKEFELKLIEKEKEYIELLDSSAVGTFIIDHENEKIHLSNSWKKRTGRVDATSENIYLNPYAFVHPEDVYELERLNKDSIVKKKKKHSSEYRIKVGDEGYRWILSQTKNIYNKEGKPIKSYGTHMDTTDRKLTEIALEESERKANELVKKLKKTSELENNFISTLAHELRNPLATMSMGVSLLDQVIPGGKVDMDTRRIIKRQTAQLTRLVDDLLNTSRIIRGKMELIKEYIEINRIVEELIEEYKALFNKEKIKLKGKYYTKPIYIDADSIRIKQAIGNLLTNSLKFTEKEGIVEVIISKDEGANDILIEIIDTGRGIDPELLPDLFEPFVQQDNSLTRDTSGLGLGLPIAKGIVDLHNGSIEARSDGIGKGTKFILRFPNK